MLVYANHPSFHGAGAEQVEMFRHLKIGIEANVPICRLPLRYSAVQMGVINAHLDNPSTLSQNV
jgi:hypothetical protein